MTSLYIVFLIIGISTAISMSYLIVSFVKKSNEMKINGFIMLFSPPAGILYYIGEFITLKLIRKERNISLEDIGFSKERHNRIRLPDAETEMQTVPLEEVFLMSTDSEKRKRLLSELKKDQISSLSTIVKAFDNDDPETSHYAAAAITNIKADYENELRRLDSQYGRSADKAKMAREYADYVLKYLKSGILDVIEMKKYSYIFISLLSTVENPKEFLTSEDYSNIVDETIFVGDYTKAEHWANESLKAEESDRSYLNLLKVFYYTNRPELFFSTLDRLKKSDIALSEEGLALVRFFIKKNNFGAAFIPPVLEAEDTGGSSGTPGPEAEVSDISVEANEPEAEVSEVPVEASEPEAEVSEVPVEANEPEAETVQKAKVADPNPDKQQHKAQNHKGIAARIKALAEVGTYLFAHPKNGNLLKGKRVIE